MIKTLCSAMVILTVMGCSVSRGGEATISQRNDETLLGVVTNPHGIRDDVAEALQKKFGNDPQKMQASLMYARAAQDMLEAVQNNRIIDQAYLDRRGLALDCFALRMGGRDFVRESREIEAMTFNTRERFKTLIEFGRRADGLIIRTKTDKNVCEKVR